HAGGVESPPQFDALPSNSYPTTSFPPAPCAVIAGQAGYTVRNLVGNNDPGTVIACAGGDGGPGIIQLPTPTLADVLVPIGAENVYKAVKPPPVGSARPTGVP